MKIRIVLLILGSFLISTDSFAISLKEQSIVSEDVIRLKDLFHGVKNNADRILGAAPRPGELITINARTLQRVAIALDLEWRPASIADHVQVSRAATVIKNQDIETAIEQKLGEKIGQNNFKLILTTAKNELVLPPNMPPTFEITSLDYNPESKWFEAKVVAPSKDNVHTTKTVMGKIQPMIKIPSLRRAMRNGDIIRETDINMINVTSNSLNHDTYLSAQKLIGMTPRRLITAGTAIKANDLEEPRVVDRGQSVTIIYQNGPIHLTASGKALQNGAKGELIRVTNMQSNKTIDAFVSGYQEVKVKIF